MTIISIGGETDQAHRRDAGIGGSFAPALSALARLVRAFSDWRKARRNELALQSMSDHLLKDMGLARGDIRARVRGLPH